MTWTHERPTKPGLYWYRRDENSQPGDYEAMRIGLDNRQRNCSVSRPDPEMDLIGTHCGEWYGPVLPLSHHADDWDPANSKPNTRIIVRLRHGGSFYVENIIPDGVAHILSTKLKSLREHGESIPAHLRMKMSDIVQELITFARASSKNEG